MPTPKAKAILCDIDGTLAHMHNRSPFDWMRVGEDKLDPVVSDILRRYAKDTKIILVSGRDAVCRPQTEAWLKKHDITYAALYMRPENDNRKDTIIKREIFDTHIKGAYDVLFVLDDRDQVVRMWRGELGLKTLQVAEGNF